MPLLPRTHLNLFANVFRNFLAFLSRRGRAALLGLALLVELNLAARLGHIFTSTIVTSFINFAPSPHRDRSIHMERACLGQPTSACTR